MWRSVKDNYDGFDSTYLIKICWVYGAITIIMRIIMDYQYMYKEKYSEVDNHQFIPTF